MGRIAVAGNTIPPLYHLIIEKDYEVKISGKYIIAIKNDFEVIAENFPELAGLIFLIENKGKDWKVSDKKVQDCLNFLNENE